VEPFAYRRATTVDDALRTPGATFLGGGTNLVDLMRLGVAAPDRLVDVSRLNAEIEETDGGGLRIGAGVRNNDLAFDDPTGTDHVYLGAGLRKALYNFMHGVGLDTDVREWFEPRAAAGNGNGGSRRHGHRAVRRVPRTTVPPDLIERSLD